MPKIKSTEYFTSNIMYLKCPHCKNMIIGSEKQTIEALKKWKKNKPPAKRTKK